MIDLKEIKNKILKKENFYLLIVIFIIFSLDRYTKIQIINHFNNETFYINNFVNLNLVWNTGIGFGFFRSNSAIIYNSITCVIAGVILFLFYLTIISKKFDKITFSIIIGGALGNFYDRIIFNGVPDFIDLHFKNFHWFTFNLADVFITVGVILILIKGLFIKDVKF